jgi:hypothetical protein
MRATDLRLSQKCRVFSVSANLRPCADSSSRASRARAASWACCGSRFLLPREIIGASSPGTARLVKTGARVVLSRSIAHGCRLLDQISRGAIASMGVVELRESCSKRQVERIIASGDKEGNSPKTRLEETQRCENLGYD